MSDYLIPPARLASATFDALLRRADTVLPGWRLRRALRRQMCRLPGASLAPLVQGHTYLSKQRLKAIERHAAALRRDGVPGAFVECGVGAGGSAALLAMLAERLGGRPLYLFDTFEGLPAPTAADPDYDQANRWTGRCRGTIDEVRALFNELGVDLAPVTFVPGLFQNTVPAWEGGRIALLHLDGDWYESTRVCLNALWDHVTPGGFVQFDDYGTWLGCRRAVDEFLKVHRLENDLRPIDGHGAWLRKKAGSSRE